MQLLSFPGDNACVGQLRQREGTTSAFPCWLTLSQESWLAIWAFPNEKELSRGG